ncbi:hypothetical protein IFM89_024395 [Coptis chinensis]|uniref:GB1/RHD3-type G domain-containing protein n=1 Tax=Coptis chinensis TaxID=261450 RepID=A0A835M3Z7_9MAGN|nr:hypothetical protein IFM89_024395 [Coptis chinensis]
MMQKIFNRGTPSSKENNEMETSSPQNPSTSSSPSSNLFTSTTTGTGPARPLRLVYCDEKGKFRMDPEAVATLQLVKGPIGVVSVCGRARQGKSFILNQGTYSTQIFSLAVLLSSMFVYNQMGGIDESAIDRLSLVTEMTKHIRVRASGGRSTASELGQFSPIFVWLLRDFYLELAEDNRKITPRDYLELALKPMQGGGKDIASKNEIRESIRGLFPDRECFTLVRPLNNEHDLQRLDQTSLDKLRPEFRSGLDALTRFVFERTRPKQVGATVMTGPILAGLTQSFLDALNNGAVPTIASSWQWPMTKAYEETNLFFLFTFWISVMYLASSVGMSVEEAECRKAYDTASEVYMASFDRSKPPDEATLREAHEEAVQKSIAAFNASAVGVGSVRQKYEKLLQTFLRRAFEEYRKSAFMEADAKCSNTIQSMEKKLRSACHGPDAKVDYVIKVLDGLLSEYEASSHGPGKWQKLTTFLQQSLEGPILDLAKKQVDQIGSEKSALMLKCRSIEDRMGLLNKQLEASEMNKTEYLRRYENAINDKKALAEDYMGRITNLQSKCSSLEERCTNLMKDRDSARQESLDWKRKCDQILSKQKAEEGQAHGEIATLKSRASATEAMLGAAREQAQSAQEEAAEWRRKFDLAAREAKAALEKAATVQERSNKQTQIREDALREEFSASLAEKEEVIKEKVSKIEYADQRLTTLSLELKAAESKLRNYGVETSALQLKIKDLDEKLESVKETAQSYERRARIVEQEKTYLEEKYLSEFKRFEEVQERCKIAEMEAKRATDLADKARAEAGTAQREKSEVQRVAMERLNQIERAERQIENLERQKADLINEVDGLRVSEMDAVSKVDDRSGGRKRSKSTNSPLKVTQADDGGSVFRGDDDNNHSQYTGSEDYTKLTVLKLKQELTDHGFGAELLQLKNPCKKRDILSLYEKHVLKSEVIVEIGCSFCDCAASRDHQAQFLERPLTKSCEEFSQSSVKFI